MDLVVILVFSSLIAFLIIAVCYLAYQLDKLKDIGDLREDRLYERLRKRDAEQMAFEDAVWAYFKEFEKRKKYKKLDKKYWGGRHDI